MHNAIEDLKGSIRVFVRVRPISEREMDRVLRNSKAYGGRLRAELREASAQRRTWRLSRTTTAR